MKEKLKSIKIDVTFSAILSVAIGVMLVFWPGTIVTVLARVIAVILMVSGITLFIPKILEPVKNYLSMVVAIMIAMIGLWMFFSPQLVASIIPIAIGVLMVVHGVQDLALAVEGKKKNANNWWSIPLMGVLSIVLGVLCICNAFGLVKIGLILIGVMLIFDGISDMFIVHKVNRASKNVVDSTITSEEDMEDYL